MSETDLVLLYTRRLESAGFTYMITGSVAGVFYGEPRVTHDVDLVLALAPSDTGRIAELFPLEEFYCPPEEIIVREVLRAQRGHFNLIHHESGFKADVYLANRDPLHRWALPERRRVDVDGEPVHVAPLEYVIVRKLEFYREGGWSPQERRRRGTRSKKPNRGTRPRIGARRGQGGLGSVDQGHVEGGAVVGEACDIRNQAGRYSLG
jgi:hypothetical protein